MSQAVKQITRIEALLDLDHDSLFWEGIHIWPLVREILANAIRQGGAVPASGPLTFNRLGWRDKVIRRIAGKHRQVEILFFSRNSDNREWLAEGRYNPLIDPLLETFRATFTCAKLEIKQPGDEKLNDLLYQPHVIELAREATEVKDNNGTFKNKFEPLRKIIRKISGIDLPAATVLHQLLVIREYALFFRALLASLRPRAVFLVCCKALPMKGLILACRELKIAAVDIQHGAQGNTNVAYHHWTRWPEKGYDLLPSHYWVWGPSFADNIRKWLAAFPSAPRVIAGGNIWIGKWLQEPQLQHQGQLKKLTSILQSKKFILVTAGVLPAALLTAIVSLPQDWLWFFRRHPQFGEHLPPVENSLRKHGITNYNTDFASEASLYLLLSNCQAHITINSTVALEALFFGRQSIILDKEGFDSFSEFHGSGALFYCNSPASIRTTISQIMNNPLKPTDTSGYLTVDSKSALRGLEKILKNF